MTKQEKEEVMDMPTVAVYSMGYTGIEIKKIEYGIEDYIIFVDPENKVHRNKIYTSSERFYFKWGQFRIYLDECIRV